MIVRRMSSGRGWGWVGRITMESSIEASDCFGIMIVLLCAIVYQSVHIYFLISLKWPMKGWRNISPLHYTMMWHWHQQMKLAAVDRIIYNYHTHVF